MKEYELKYVKVFKENKDGQPYKSKNGKPFVRVSIKVEDYGDNYISGLWFEPDCDWKIGEKKELIITKEIYQGKEQLKFEIPKKEDKTAQAIERLVFITTQHTLKIAEMEKKFLEHLGIKPKITGTDIDYPDAPEGETPF